MAREAEISQGLGPAGGAPAAGAVLLSNRSETPEIGGVRAALRPLVELCLAPGAETPFAIGLVGERGSGKSFALRRLLDGAESLARAAGKSGASAFLSRIVVVRVDALLAEGDEASAVAAAVFGALEQEREGVSYTQLADEAAHATSDPRRAAAVAAERHDEAVRRLEQEREARDEVESKRARIMEALLFETPGSRVDAFARASRGKIEGRLRRFGFVDGDPGANYRSLLRDMSGLGASGRVGVFLRTMWAYRGQAGLLASTILAFALAILLRWLRSPGGGAALTSLSAQFAPALAWVNAHDEALEYLTEGLVVVAFASLFVNLWRAASFTSLLFRGARLLTLDIRERRRELDATAARLERRVATLQAEADAASQRAETLSRRAGSGGAHVARAPGPVFHNPTESSAIAARDFLRELARAMAAGATPAPQRLLLAVDNVDLLPPREARRMLDVITQLLGPGMAAIVACDPSRLGDAAAEALFEVVCDVRTLSPAPGDSLAASLLAAPAFAPSPLGGEDAGKSALSEPLSEDEKRSLMSASALIGPTPRAMKRFLNAYRLARLGDAPRPGVAVCLAAQMAHDSNLAPALRWALFSDGEIASLPPQLAAAAENAGLAQMDRAAAQAAWSAALRYAPEAG